MRKLINRKNEMIQDVSIFSISTYFAQIIFFIRGFLNATIVGPTMYGLWSALNIILSIGSYVHLGTLHGMSREIPISVGKGDYVNVDNIRKSTFGFSLIASIVASFFIIMFSLVFKERLGSAEIIGIVTVCILIIVQGIVNFYETALAAIKRFSVIAFVDFLFPVICIVLTIILVPKWKIYGVYAVALFISLGMCLFYFFTTRYVPELIFDLRKVFSLIKIGYPLMSLLLFPVILFSIDRILILKFLGPTKLGYYALALLICKFIFYLPAVVAKVIEPRLFRKYGETENIMDLKKYLLVPARSMAIFLPLFISIVYLGSSFIIRHYMVEYLPSLTPLFIIIFGKFFLAFSPTSISFLTALNKQYKVMYFYLVAIILNAFFDFLILILGYDLIGVAIVTVTVSFLLGMSLFIYALSFYLKGVINYLKTCVRFFLPYIFILGISIALNFLFKSRGTFLLDSLFIFLKILVVVLASVPFVSDFNKEFKLFDEIRSIFKYKWRTLLARQQASDISVIKGEL